MPNAPHIGSRDGLRSPLTGRHALLCLDDVVGWAVSVDGTVATADEAVTSPRRRVRRLGNQAARRNARFGDLAARWPSVGRPGLGADPAADQGGLTSRAIGVDLPGSRCRVPSRDGPAGLRSDAS